MILPRFLVKKIVSWFSDYRVRSLKSPFFYLGIISVVLMGVLFFSSEGLAQLGSDTTNVVFFNAALANTYQASTADAFVGQQTGNVSSTPALSVIQDNFIAALTPPYAVSLQTLGDISSGTAADS
ncbi:MAG: hypothetical protein ACREHG_10905, partial [Candidatus Saccharimonadales bacterium]